MSATVGVLFGIMIVLGSLASPMFLIWGWTRWIRLPKVRTIPAILSLVGFMFATASALVAISTIVYAQIHHFPYYDPLLLKIFRWGFLLSLGGVTFGISGLWRSNPLRWLALVAGFCTLLFWIMAASGE